MANTFKNARLAVTTSLSDVYTCPSSTTAIVIGCQVANVDGTNAATIELAVYDNSGATTTYLIKGGNVPANASLAPIDGKVVLEASDKIKAKASADGDLELNLSVLEIT